MSNLNNIIPTKVEYIHDILAYNKEFKALIYTSYKTSIKKSTIESHITLKYKNYKDIETISTISEIIQDLEIKNPMCGSYGTRLIFGGWYYHSMAKN